MFIFKTKRPKNREYTPHTPSITFLPKVKISISSGCHHPKRKLLTLKEVSLDSSLKEEAPNIELPNDENKLFDVDDDAGISTIPDLSVPSKDEEEEVISNILGTCH